jgi:hypothetical protein
VILLHRLGQRFFKFNGLARLGKNTVRAYYILVLTQSNEWKEQEKEKQLSHDV